MKVFSPSIFLLPSLLIQTGPHDLYSCAVLSHIKFHHARYRHIGMLMTVRELGILSLTCLRPHVHALVSTNNSGCDQLGYFYFCIPTGAAGSLRVPRKYISSKS